MIRGFRVRRSSPLVLFIGCCALTACQPQGTAASGADATVSTAVPPLPQAAPINLATACAEPWGSGPFTEAGPPLSAPPVIKPARAAREHVSGCAGLRFRIAADGTPTDVEVLVEAPAGYGFGEAAAQALGASRFAPGVDGAFHYQQETMK
jgi:hypothetical protein